MTDKPELFTSNPQVNTARIVRPGATVPEICMHNVKLGQGCFCPHCPTASYGAAPETAAPPDLSLLSDARLVWAMACDCECKACQALDVIIRRVLGDPPALKANADLMSKECSECHGTQEHNNGCSQIDPQDIRGSEPVTMRAKRAAFPCQFEFKISHPERYCLNCGWMVRDHRRAKNGNPTHE